MKELCSHSHIWTIYIILNLDLKRMASLVSLASMRDRNEGHVWQYLCTGAL